MTSVLTTSGLRTASTRASSPPRLCPITTTRRPVRFSQLSQGDLEAPDRSLRAINVQPHPGRRGARTAATQPSAEHRQRGVAGHEPGHQQDGRGIRLTPGTQKGGIADQARKLEPVAKLASQRRIHSFTLKTGGNLRRAFGHACGFRAQTSHPEAPLRFTLVESKFEFKYDSDLGFPATPFVPPAR